MTLLADLRALLARTLALTTASIASGPASTVGEDASPLNAGVVALGIVASLMDDRNVWRET